jgi:hypothetical protein
MFTCFFDSLNNEHVGANNMKTVLPALSLVFALNVTSAVADEPPRRQGFLVEAFTCKARVDLEGVDLAPWEQVAVDADEANPEADEIDRYLIEGFAVTFGPEDCSPELPRNRGPQGFIGVLERIEICGGVDNYRVLHPGEFYEVEHEGQLWTFEGPGVVLHGGPELVCGGENPAAHDSVVVVQYLLLRGFPADH